MFFFKNKCNFAANIFNQRIMNNEKCDDSYSDLKDAKILLVDDNPVNQKIVLISIQNLVNSIDVANNGQEAIDKFASGCYDVIIMDIQMPVMDGVQATRKIREMEVERGLLRTPIIGNTAHSAGEERDRCMKAGMDDGFFGIPLKAKDLKDLVLKMYNQKKSQC